MAYKNTTLIYDINKICDFVFGEQNSRNSDVEITETFQYEDDGSGQTIQVPIMKEVKEVKQSDNSNQNTIRYDMMRMFIDILNDVQDDDLMTLGERITLNTMEAYGLIKDSNEAEIDE